MRRHVCSECGCNTDCPEDGENAYKFWLAIGIASAVMAICIFVCAMIVKGAP
jgi:hypothetical protein